MNSSLRRSLVLTTLLTLVLGVSGAAAPIALARSPTDARVAGIDIDAENELDIACPVATDPIVNQALRRIVRPVIGNALHQRGGAVTHADHGDLNRLHQLNPFRQTLIVRWSALPL